MRIQDHIVSETRSAAAEAFRYARQVPAEKATWKPLDEGRSVLELCQEMAMAPGWSAAILRGDALPSFDENGEIQTENAPVLDSIEACEAVAKAKVEEFCAAVLAFPDDRLEEKYTLPMDGGQEITMRENMDYPRWNFTYHLGQIAYIQTLYGDKKMYW